MENQDQNRKSKFDWELFAKAHRPKTVEFCRMYCDEANSGKIRPDAVSFAVLLKEAVKVRMSPKKARSIYRFLVKCGALVVLGEGNEAQK